MTIWSEQHSVRQVLLYSFAGYLPVRTLRSSSTRKRDDILQSIRCSYGQLTANAVSTWAQLTTIFLPKHCNNVTMAPKRCNCQSQELIMAVLQDQATQHDQNGRGHAASVVCFTICLQSSTWHSAPGEGPGSKFWLTTVHAEAKTVLACGVASWASSHCHWVHLQTRRAWRHAEDKLLMFSCCSLLVQWHLWLDYVSFVIVHWVGSRSFVVVFSFFVTFVNPIVCPSIVIPRIRQSSIRPMVHSLFLAFVSFSLVTFAISFFRYRQFVHVSIKVVL